MRTEPVLLVHGFASSFDLNWRRNGWPDLLADAKREVIAVDLLGHGTAAKPHDPAAYADLEQCVIDVLPTDGRVVDAVGFSLGAVTLLRAVGRAPTRFGRIVVGGIGEQNMVAGDSEATAMRSINALVIDRPAGTIGTLDERMVAEQAHLSGLQRRALGHNNIRQIGRASCRERV